MTKRELFRSALAQARQVSRLKSKAAKEQQIRMLLSTLREALK